MMAERIILITGRDTEKRRYLITKATERISRDDTIFISIGYEDSVDPLSYKEGIDWLIDSFRYLEAPKKHSYRYRRYRPSHRHNQGISSSYSIGVI